MLLMFSKFDGCYRYLTYDDLAKTSLSAMTKKLNNQSLDLLCPTFLPQLSHSVAYSKNNVNFSLQEMAELRQLLQSA